MSGGISAIKGFDYQATVILDLLFRHFEKFGATGQVRPEGVDDLDLQWVDRSLVHRQYVQIKKPTEDNDGVENPTSWTVAEAGRQLIPNTIKHLQNNAHRQVWVLGDEVDSALRSLVDAGINAPLQAVDSFWQIVHTLARDSAVRSSKLGSVCAAKLLRRRAPKHLPTTLVDAEQQLINHFVSFAKIVGADSVAIDRYCQNVSHLAASLPDILARIEIRSTFGSEKEVAERVQSRLEQDYGFERVLVEKTVFRNLRGFIYDISKQPRLAFTQEDFEVELRNVWPAMVPIKIPPEIGQQYIRRPDITERVINLRGNKAIEILGISGSGKTMLASEIAHGAHVNDPEREIYYAEVRQDVSLRDVLAGIAFHLRRIGIVEPFRIAIDSKSTDEAVITDIARILAVSDRRILLLLDLVEGSCSPAFARHISTFVQALPSGKLEFAVFAQESVLQQMSQLERDQHGLELLDVRGFDFEEFVALVACQHTNVDRAVLWNVYQRITAGRAAGLYAKLAQSLATAASLEEMTELAAKPAEDVLPAAERKRFRRISEGSRSAAEKLVCFALPFSRRDAEQVFPGDNIGEAIQELTEFGLVRPQGEDLFEMHETVRAGLENGISLGLRRNAHSELAKWYRSQGTLTAEILHLDKANRHEEALQRARDAFLQGMHWGALYRYVVSNKLVSSSEVIGIMADVNKSIDYQFLLSGILRELGDADMSDELFAAIRKQPARFVSDFSWATTMVEATLQADPKKLHDLILYALVVPGDSTGQSSAFDMLTSGIRRTNAAIESRTLELFDRQPPEVKARMVPILLLNKGRAALARAFQFFADEQAQPPDRNARQSHTAPRLHLQNCDEAIEFLAAMPDVEAHQMLIAKSALLGALTGLVWSERATLRQYCVAVVENGSQEDRVLTNAIRILIFLADPKTITLCEPLLTRTGSLAAFAALVPALVPAFSGGSHYEQRALDASIPLNERVSALSVLSALGSDLGAVYQRLQKQESFGENAEMWNTFFLMFCVQTPFLEAIPLLEQRINKPGDTIHILDPVLLSILGEMPTPAATSLLIGALNHSDPRMRRLAATTLQHRRARSALGSLVEQYKTEGDSAIAVALAVAIVASGPTSIGSLERSHEDNDALKLWQCILAMRLRDKQASHLIVNLACDSMQNWQLRRAAILAAGRLPYTVALEKIVPVVMAERSTLTLDNGSHLYCHTVIGPFLLEHAEEMRTFFARGRASFVNFFAEIFESQWKGAMFSNGTASGPAAAGWLYDRLAYHGWPQSKSAAQLVVNELHVPILHGAVIRSLRLLGCTEIIEKTLEQSNYVWLSAKCIKERLRIDRPTGLLGEKLKILVSLSPCKDNSFLDSLIDDFCGLGQFAPRSTAPAEETKVVEAPKTLRLAYDDIIRLLAQAEPDVATSSIVIESLNLEQCTRLIDILDPANDHRHSASEYVPSISFWEGGHVVAQRRTTTSGRQQPLRPRLRAALAAANQFGLDIRWHHEQLTGPLSIAYLPIFLECLASQENSERFYDELDRYPDAIGPFICDTNRLSPILKFTDVRIVSFLSRYSTSGTDVFFEGLCNLASRVATYEIDSVLASLFHRWTQRFNPQSNTVQQYGNVSLWRAFKLLTEHPRFEQIDRWHSRLTSVLQARMMWFDKQNVVRVLERDPRSYTQIESMLFKAADFEHSRDSELDRLDDAAERLFHRILEG
jgi:hypothetical protein